MAININERESLSALILAITKTGDLYLDPAQVKQVKAICKKSDANAKIAYELLMIQLQRKHAQIRFSSTQLIAELFQRSHVFRELLVADYSIFLQLTVGIHQNTLPPPAVFAEKTKQLAISLTNEWNSKYGAVYKQIVLGYEFLRYHLKVDFTNLTPVTEEARSAEQRAQEEMSRRLRKKRYDKAAAEIDDKAEDIQENLRKMNSCFDILVPKLDDDVALNALFAADLNTSEERSTEAANDQMEIMEEEGESSNIIDEELPRHDPIGVYENALGSNRYKLTINVNRDNPVDVTESEDNTELFTTLRECYLLIIKKHLPMVVEWLDVLMKADHEPGEQRLEYDRLLRMAIDFKKNVVDAKSKCEDLGVNMDTMYGPDENNSDEDGEELEEVEIPVNSDDKKKGKQVKRNVQKIEPRKPRNPVFAMHGEDVLEDDPTYIGGTRISSMRSSGASVAELDSSSKTKVVSNTPTESKGSDTESREDLLARAPVIPWDDDLAVWDKKEMAFNTSGLEYSHRFLGVGDGSNMVSQETLDRMKMRTRIYNPELPKVIKACRFPMSNGRLCPRRDLVRCPYHGPIVPRDENGQIQVPHEEGGFVSEDGGLDDTEEVDLINRAIAAASGSSSSGSGTKSRRPKEKSTWEDIEDDVNLALGLEKIEPKRRRGQANDATSKRKKGDKPPSALVNISKAPDSSRVRLLKHVGSKASKDSVEQDRRMEKATLSKDSRMHRW
ncbi:hypothetical protein BGZ80_000621 [Entomortierella chlamydospora]|uniref:UV-stimulated scaffold protein A C-terminal domain-containing protein n=1 Tax=Entomortierella chlamydospora TaxID=101097 RepID=A0A9P6SYH3_9FUNG|nr:hypothetical protein BGZ79_005983 [Entomortierella chlamydospora]KAG0011531.1 hypothetical protein BGZ80_000621 [Entomortierella chlamydospora]